ncbi:ATP-binding protein [Xanthomonas graminis]|nr:ATP-binding protein [Xanthomonas translucens]
MSAPAAPCVLVVEDESAIADTVLYALRSEGYQVRHCLLGREALAQARAGGITDAAGVVVFDSRGQDLGRDNSRWNDVYRTLRGEYGARSSAEGDGEPVPPPPPRRDEIGDLGRALETMRRKLAGKAYVEQYVQSLTHERKSPLAAIRGAAELLQEPLPEAERQCFVRNIAEQQQRLTETIDKLLALAEVEQHGWLQRRERIALAPLFAQLAEALAPQLRASGVRLQVHTPDAELALAGDPYLVRQALHNLPDNAIAFSPAGGTVVLRAERAAHARIALLVEDAGPGVPAYALQRVFERFYSLPRPATGQRSSGLGLSFVREVARLHGGEASLRNRACGGALARLVLG